MKNKTKISPKPFRLSVECVAEINRCIGVCSANVIVYDATHPADFELESITDGRGGQISGEFIDDRHYREIEEAVAEALGERAEARAEAKEDR